jgi:DNA-binding SARP family transcriptional activator
MKCPDPLNISLLGPLEIRRGSRRIELPSSKKARGLLAYLIVNRRQHRRDRLTELLWDVADDPKGGLRWCLSKIRPLVDEPQGPRIVADRETAEFRAEDLEVDCFIVRDGIQRGMTSLTLKELEDLASLFRGSFLEGLELPDYHSFQAWLIAAREDALSQHVSILRAIVYELSDDAARATPYARLLVERDPLDENSRATLSRFLVRLGRHSEARQLIETGKRLASELGTGGSGVLEQTARELPRRATADAEPPTTTGRFPEWGSPTAMIGREEERARVRSLLNSSSDSRRGHVVLITGGGGGWQKPILSGTIRRHVVWPRHGSLRPCIRGGSAPALWTLD